MLPWLMERGTVPIAEAAAQFGVSEHELVDDLQLAAVCGLPPYDYEMIDLWIDEVNINVGIPRLFTRPLRLTAHEAFALLAAAEAASLLPRPDPAGALERALAKVRAKLGSAVDVVGDAPRFTEDVQAAAAAGEVLEIEYWTPSRDEVTRRRIVPRVVFSHRGDYYVAADDERSGSERHFRIDRIQSLGRTGEQVPLRQVEVEPETWFADDDVAIAVLRLDPEAQWVSERYPVRNRVDLGDGRVEVELAVANERWLERLLLRLGNTGSVVSPPELTGLGRASAVRVLARYESSSAPASADS